MFGSRDNRRATLADVIDIELQLANRRQHDRETLIQQDHDIGARIRAAELSSRQAILAWADTLRPAGGPSPGQIVEQYRELAAVVLACLGFVAGAGLVWGWLTVEPGRPVNIIYFWAILVGLPLALWCGWLIAVIPPVWVRAIPGVRAVHFLLRRLGQWLPALLLRIPAVGAGSRRRDISATLGRFRQVDRLYRRLYFWVAMRLVQGVAAAFAAGCLAALVAAFHLTDPALGWRSRKLHPEQVHRIAAAVATPAEFVVPEVTPSLEEVRRTRYSSFDRRFAQDPVVWETWYPFMLASLVLYSLLPRLLAWTMSALRVRVLLRTMRFDWGEARSLTDRLRHPLVSTAAPKPEVFDAAEDSGSSPVCPRQEPETPVLLMRWDGLNADDAILEYEVSRSLGLQVENCLDVGGLDVALDEAAISTAAGTHLPVVLVVGAWEAPVADYRDFLRRLRAALGAETLIRVALAGDGPGDTVNPPREEDVAIWQRELARMGDPYLCVVSLQEVSR